MPPTFAAVPRSTTLASLRTRRDLVARQVHRCEAKVERLRRELTLPPLCAGVTSPAERAMSGAMRELTEARARLAQITRDLRRIGSA
jgi:hypothetical protein